MELKAVIADLNKGNGKYAALLKECQRLGTEYRKIDGEIKSHVTTVKEHTQKNTKIIERIKQQIKLNGNNIPNRLAKIETTVKKLQTRSEDLKKKFTVIIDGVSGVCSNAKVGDKGSEDKADLAEKVGIVFLFSFVFFGGMIATNPIIGFASFFCGFPLGGIGSLSLFLLVVKGCYQKCAEKNKVLYKNLNQIDGILFEKFNVLIDICRLLNDIQDAVHNMSLARPSSDTGSPSGDDTNDFLIGLELKSFKEASVKLEKKCDDFLQSMPLETVLLELFLPDKKCIT